MSPPSGGIGAQFGSNSGQDLPLSRQETILSPFRPQTSAYLDLEWCSKIMFLSFKPKRTIQSSQAKVRDDFPTHSRPLHHALCTHLSGGYSSHCPPTRTRARSLHACTSVASWCSRTLLLRVRIRCFPECRLIL